MESERGAVYCTLLLSNNYLPGAMVLAHSLRDNGTKAKLVALYTPDTLQTATINELRTAYDELIPVHSIVNGTPANLLLMDRPDLVATFTKIELWRLTQFERIVYIDCDIVAVRAPDELLSLEVDFAAAPDVGWPDCFNSGLMVLRPNMQDYYALKALAERGISFDGADQGLLNMHFRDWHRLSFTYNCTPSANYQYIPAYRHFQSTISLLHFIGSQKPWNLPRQVVPLESPYNQLLGRWWAVYDRHYRPPFVSISEPESKPPRTLHRTEGEKSAPSVPSGNPVPTVASSDETWSEPPPVGEGNRVRFHHEHAGPETAPALVTPERQQTEPSHQQHDGHHPESYHKEAPPSRESTAVPVLSAVPQYVRGEEHVSTYVRPSPHIPTAVFHGTHQSLEHQAKAHSDHHEHRQPEHHQPGHGGTHIYQPQPISPQRSVEQIYQRAPSPEPQALAFEAPRAEWDASREPPPLNSKPEGISLQQKTYTMSEDTSLFQPPQSYPEAPKNMYYDVPAKKPEPQRLAPIFPWEIRAPKPTRVFAHEQSVPALPSREQDAPSQRNTFSPPSQDSYEATTESWASYSRSNAWDEDPHIQRYIESITEARRAKAQVIAGSAQPSTEPALAPSLTGPESGHRPSIKLTDFPTEAERPSLPVTPAPIQRRTSGNGDGGSPAEERVSSAATTLPAAEGVPSQEDWNPLARLEELRRRQSAVLEDPEHLLSRLSELAGPSSSDDVPAPADDQGGSAGS